jgi:AbrB family looped-hinge helix DNA binding protein
MKTAHKTKVSNGGRVVIPSEYRKAMGISVGDKVVIRFEEGELRLQSLCASIIHAQQVVKKYTKSGRSAVDELIKERRREAGRE